MSPPIDPLARSVSPEDLPDPATSLSLLRRAQAGDRPALEDLVTRYQERLRRIVRIQLGSTVLRRHLDSMDIVQCTFQAAVPRLREFEPRSANALLHWLATIAVNQLRDAHNHHRAARRDLERERPIEGDSTRGASPLPTPADDRAPDEEAALNEVRELLDAEVARLPEDQRRVVLLRDYVGEEWDGIARDLGREAGAARQLHQRAWIRLRQVLRPKLEQKDRTP